MKYYVDCKAEENGNGSSKLPFKTIGEANEVVLPGDEVIVLPGVYREWVCPKTSGNKGEEITYRAKSPLMSVITGAEVLTNWTKVPGKDGVWTNKVDNKIFGDYNPYTTLVWGDWFIEYIVAHTGDVYLNDKSMYEVTDIKKVENPEKNNYSWDAENSKYVWFSKQDEEKNETHFYANFGDKNPNEEKVEISVRRNCFMPDKNGVDYIKLIGFTVCKAATNWAPPTAYQDGMIGPHWSKGWTIENCEIYESKCSGISLGKYYQEGNDNKWSRKKYKDGTQTQRDCVCLASIEGWDKEHVGGHTVRGCNIHDCGQTGIVGHMGSAFCLIEDNEIHHINNKQNLAGAEIGGIKFHAAIDTVIRRNHFHHCTRGIWLDWEAQGTRVSGNLFHDNTLAVCRDNITKENIGEYMGQIGEDLFIEVSHGPTLVDNNIFLSERAVKFPAQGGAFVHNLFGGAICCIGRGTQNGAPNISSDRYTPYHSIHGTKVLGFMTILHGDTRFYNNIFAQTKTWTPFTFLQEELKANPNSPMAMWDDLNFQCGTHIYDEYPTFEEWDKWFEGYCGMGSNPKNPDRYYDHLPVWAEGNVYLGGAKAWKKELKPVIYEDFLVKLNLIKQENQYSLETNIYEAVKEGCKTIIDTDKLGEAFESEEKFENPDGSPLCLDKDFLGMKRSKHPCPGPFEFDTLKKQENIKLMIKK